MLLPEDPKLDLSSAIGRSAESKEIDPRKVLSLLFVQTPEGDKAFPRIPSIYCGTRPSRSTSRENIHASATWLARFLGAKQEYLTGYGILPSRCFAALKSATGVDDNERRKLLDQWERVSFRIFGLFNKDSRTKVGDYVLLASKIVTEDIETRTYNQIMAGIRELRHERMKGGPRGANKARVLQSSRGLSVLTLVLRRTPCETAGGGATIDEHEKNGIWKLRASDSIEHIFPKAPTGSVWRDKMRSAVGPKQPIEPNVDRIGNLILLPIKLNQEAKNSPFVTKKTTYRKHNLRMIQQVCDESDWTLSTIEAREARIVAWAKARWSDV